MSDDKQNTTWIPLDNDSPCETVLMATNEQFRKFAMKVAAFNVYSENCLFCEKTEFTNDHDNDCIWIEAKLIIAGIDEYYENT